MALPVKPLGRSLIAVAMALAIVTLVRADDAPSDGGDGATVEAPAPGRATPPSAVVVDRPIDHEEELGGGARSAPEVEDDSDDDDVALGRRAPDQDAGDLDGVDDDADEDGD